MNTEQRKAQNKLNKQRSKSMERYIANYFSQNIVDMEGIQKQLKGSRVPMSGSGSLKGDCIVPYDEFRSILIECKLTSKPILRIQQAWLEKLLKEQEDMRCFMSMLVVHFMNTSLYYCLIPKKSISRFEYDKRKSVTVNRTYSDTFEGKSIPFEHKWVKKEKPPFWIQTQHGKWYILDHEDCKTLLEN